MTEEEVLGLIRTGSGKHVLEALSGMPGDERRAHAKPVAALFKEWWDARWSFRENADPPPKIADEESLAIAVLATGVPSEFTRYGSMLIPRKVPIQDVIGAFKPDWTDRWVSALIAESPNAAGRLAPLWRAGLCARPTDDAYILSYYAHHRGHGFGVDDPLFLAEDVWRFFEVEGGGEFSLAAHDKYSAPALTWSTILAKACDKGKLDRQRLLDATLDALDRDFAQFRAGWYSRFHTVLEPTPDELAARKDRYLRLLSSAIPPTVSFALKALKTLDKAKALSPDDVFDHITPALQVAQKSTANGALQLLAASAKRAPERGMEAARLAVAALVSEASDIQGKALDLVAKLGGADDPETREMLAAHIDLVAPSLRARVREMSGATSESPAQETSGAVADAARIISPLEDANAALTAFLEVLETPRDPFAVERAMEALSLYGTSLDPDTLSPLRKRARQILANPGDSDIRFALAVTGLAWADGVSVETVLHGENPDPECQFINAKTTARVFLDRNAEVVERVLVGYALPMLSAPSDTSGVVAPEDLARKVVAYRTAGIEPGPVDLNLAFMRLGTEGRAAALEGFEAQSESDRAICYALGASDAPGTRADLWSAAWAARRPRETDDKIVALCGKPAPDLGQPADCRVVVKKDGNDGYFWATVTVDVSPVPRECAPDLLPALFYLPQQNKYFAPTPCGFVYPDVAWASLFGGAWQEPFFKQAILAMDTYQKLTDHFCLAYLEPFFRPGFVPGPLGVSTLAYYLASEDKSVSGLAAEAVALLAGTGRLEAADLAGAIEPLMSCGPLPVTRWTKTLARVAEAGTVEAGFVARVLEGVMGFDAGAPPRDIGGMVELLFELHTGAGTVPGDRAVESLSTVSAGGKLGRFAKKLVAMAG